MLQVPVPFPHAGSRAFVRGTADPVTIIRHNADGTALVRREARPLERRNRDASGNTTLARADLFETPEEAALQNTPRVSRSLKRRAPASAGLAPRKGSGARSRLRQAEPAGE